MSDPLTEPREPGQTPYHLRNGTEADPEVERRHAQLLARMEQLHRERQDATR